MQFRGLLRFRSVFGTAIAETVAVYFSIYVVRLNYVRIRKKRAVRSETVHELVAGFVF